MKAENRKSKIGAAILLLGLLLVPAAAGVLTYRTAVQAVEMNQTSVSKKESGADSGMWTKIQKAAENIEEEDLAQIKKIVSENFEIRELYDLLQLVRKQDLQAVKETVKEKLSEKDLKTLKEIYEKYKNDKNIQNFALFSE